MNDFKNLSNKLTFDITKNNNIRNSVIFNNPSAGVINKQNNLNLKNTMSSDLPTISSNSSRDVNLKGLENQKVLNLKEKSENVFNFQGKEKQIVKLNKIKSSSNKSLPSVQLSEEEKNVELSKVLNTEGNEYKKEKKIIILLDKDLQSKTFYENKIYKTKVNFVDKVADKNTAMVQTNNNNSNSNLVKNNKLISSESIKNYEYKKYKKINNNAKSKLSIIKNNYSIEKLEPDFNFKTTQINFDPFNNPRNSNKFVFAPMLR